MKIKTLASITILFILSGIVSMILGYKTGSKIFAWSELVSILILMLAPIVAILTDKN